MREFFFFYSSFHFSSSTECHRRFRLTFHFSSETFLRFQVSVLHHHHHGIVPRTTSHIIHFRTWLLIFTIFTFSLLFVKLENGNRVGKLFHHHIKWEKDPWKAEVSSSQNVYFFYTWKSVFPLWLTFLIIQTFNKRWKEKKRRYKWKLVWV